MRSEGGYEVRGRLCGQREVMRSEGGYEVRGRL